ncbi:MAG: hypothetical protein COV74_10920 [Candidatus Omnitrophica bacterium CG11_big_fil_rev_8_21_14_0_20_45_26]|uniref:Lipoprotein n=1 Tax=Candidatus Abzuiibacterium crystallinum TaxID=1974748 RepID=A0A2H0LL10_9BACT|nr:MAG: hypothetical protein COV74_10920 [Candidatus Omnitrophica bacterium CG11_big_fil_rev_8_21_14_0_20_45_26]PIW63822.1 MAG: hypothetical protein COW12_07890 [Candidatus Omnitrophica bacterium CG12_big_fil_rev_8_21_14_0_65_45_16]
MNFKRILKSVLVLLLFFGCMKFYLLSPFYVLSDIFYFMPKSAFDTYDGEGRQGMVWFPITRLQHALTC